MPFPRENRNEHVRCTPVILYVTVWYHTTGSIPYQLVFKICGVYFHRNPHALKSTLLIGIRLPYLPLPWLATVFGPGDLLGS